MRAGVALVGILLAVGFAAGSPQASGEYAGPGWVLLRLHHESTTTFELEFVGGGAGTDGGLNILTPAGESVFFGTGGSTQQDTYFVVQQGEFRQDRRLLNDPAAPGTLGGTFHAPPFDGYALFWSVGDMATTRWRVHSTDPETSVSLVQSGEGGHYNHGRGMDGDLQIVGNSRNGAIAIQQNAHLPFVVHENFVGLIGADGGAGIDDVWLERDDGRVYCRPCLFFGMSGEFSLGAGSYTIWRNATTAERSFPTTILAGVEIPWPPE